MLAKDIVNKIKQTKSSTEQSQVEEQSTLYRVVPTEYVELYKTNPSEVPFVSGAVCIEKHKNSYEYEANKEYVHFFIRLRDAADMFNDYESVSGNCTILKFTAPNELIEQNTATGRYITEDCRFVDKDEVVIPKEDFLQQVKLTGEIEREEYYTPPSAYDPDAYMY